MAAYVGQTSDEINAKATVPEAAAETPTPWRYPGFRIK